MNALILDTETTGLDEPQPVEIAWRRLQGPAPLVMLDHFMRRYKPSKPISLGALATHHIMDEDLIDCEPSPAIFPLPEGAEYLIGHNVDFDWEVIGKPDVKRIDTCCLCRKLWPTADSYSLGAMLYLLERKHAREDLRQAHSAGQDVLNCAIVLHYILLALGEPSTWEELWQQCEVARIPEIMTFGKHKGMRIADVPADYKSWLLRQPDIDPYLTKALRGGRA